MKVLFDFESLTKEVYEWLGAVLPADLCYHGLHHTKDVLDAVETYIIEEKIVNEHDQMILKTGALMHDIGFARGYNNHEERGVEIAKELLPKHNYTPEEIEIVGGLIMATKVPQSPKTHLEEVLCDCDLDYLGREDFDTISKNLFQEWRAFNLIGDVNEFNQKQIRFLEMHDYYTDFARNKRAPKKALVIEHLKTLI